MAEPPESPDSSVAPAPPQTHPETGPPAAAFQPWGPWTSLGLALVVLVVHVLLQVAVIAGCEVAAKLLEAGGGAAPTLLRAPGFLTALSLALATPPAAALVVLAAGARGPAGRYLGLRLAGWRTTLLSAAGLAAFLVAYNLVGSSLDRPPVPEFLLEVYRTAGSLPLLYFALALLAPAFEELLFRGFLLPGLAGRWGEARAILVGALLWAGIHFQYDFYDRTGILLLGVGLGWLRLRTGSTWLVILLHAGNNLLATLQVGWYLEGGLTPR